MLATKYCFEILTGHRQDRYEYKFCAKNSFYVDHVTCAQKLSDWLMTLLDRKVKSITHLFNELLVFVGFEFFSSFLLFVICIQAELHNTIRLEIVNLNPAYVTPRNTAARCVDLSLSSYKIYWYPGYLDVTNMLNGIMRGYRCLM